MSAETKRTENKASRGRTATKRAPARKKTTDRAKAFEQDMAASRGSGPEPASLKVHDSVAAAASAAKKEAEAAGVTPVAVMASATDGYGSGTGEKVKLAGKKDGPAVEERTSETQTNEYPKNAKDTAHPKELSYRGR